MKDRKGGGVPAISIPLIAKRDRREVVGVAGTQAEGIYALYGNTTMANGYPEGDKLMTRGGGVGRGLSECPWEGE